MKKPNTPSERRDQKKRVRAAATLGLPEVEKQNKNASHGFQTPITLTTSPVLTLSQRIPDHHVSQGRGKFGSKTLRKRNNPFFDPRERRHARIP
jgi:hypothetical protein